MLEIESKKNKKVLAEGASSGAPSAFCDDFIFQGNRVGRIMKKKAKSKAAKTGKSAKTKAKSKSARPRGRRESNPAEVRKDISKIVRSGARRITKAVMEQAGSGQLAPARYLFEVAGIYPALTDGAFATEDEECLAKTLMRRLNLPDNPIPLDDEDEMGNAESPAVEGNAAPTETQPESSEGDGAEARDVPALARTIP